MLFVVVLFASLLFLQKVVLAAAAFLKGYYQGTENPLLTAKRKRSPMFNHAPEDERQSGPGKSHHKQMSARQAAGVTSPLFYIGNARPLG